MSSAPDQHDPSKKRDSPSHPLNVDWMLGEAEKAEVIEYYRRDQLPGYQDRDRCGRSQFRDQQDCEEDVDDAEETGKPIKQGRLRHRR